MAENNEYVIRIVNETQSTAPEVGGAGGINADSGNSLGATNAGKSGNTTNKAAKALQGLFSAHTAVNMTKQAISFGVSQVQIETGSREMQQRASALYSAGTALTGIVAAGIAGGPATAGVALLGTLISKATSILFEMESIANQRRLEDIARNLSAQRVTVSGSRYMNASEF